MARVAIGVDIAYSSGAGSDWTVLLLLGEDAIGRLFVIDVRRAQQPTPITEAQIRETRAEYPDARCGSYVSGPEVGVLDLMMEHGVEVERLPARWNKLVRAQKSSIAWNKAEIWVPEGAEWLDAFLHEIHYFTGTDDATDDQVDALVSAYALIESGRPIEGFGGGFGFGTPCM